MAKKLGATRDEIKDTILITLSVVGLKGVVKINELAEGIYFIKFQNEKGIVCKKFIKNKQ
jgi:alkylhydroperoxidase/carboxymuconolactone decarboxylase family protein YurZ